ncbi:Gp49 family protein [Fodinicurvata sediminis]|uniref:Gp49 family protein n=1 Tax=Fodinicurvata sediminis TaxID=1121832 RepID=UPI000421C243|nr:Gp49 family protein [Fodinicurvata sediminis]
MNPNLMTDDELAAALAEDRPGPHVTAEAMAKRVRDAQYTVLPNSTVTICNITLDNGYSVRGESACVDPANYDADIGRKIAHDDAFRKLWPLFGFLLAEQRYQARGG